MIGSRLGRVAVAVLTVVLAGAPVAVARDGAGMSLTVRANPLGVVLDVSATSLALGKSILAKATVTNAGTASLGDIVVELRLDRAGLAIRKGVERGISEIKGGKTESVTWSICAASPGSYLLLAQATADGATVESAARIVTVTGTGRKAC